MLVAASVGRRDGDDGDPAAAAAAAAIPSGLFRFRHRRRRRRSRRSELVSFIASYNTSRVAMAMAVQ